MSAHRWGADTWVGRYDLLRDGRRSPPTLGGEVRRGERVAGRRADSLRGGGLERRCGLGREVESLLASYERADGFLEGPPEISPLHAYGIPLDARAPTLRAGRKLGPYQILELLGAGGMGEV